MRIVSCPAWYHCVSYRPEISRLRFAALEMTVGRGGDVNHTDGKLLANSFLSGMRTLCFNSIGDYLRIVSCPAWYHCVSYRPEISRLRFAALEMTVGRGGDVNHTDGKLSAEGALSGVGLVCFNSIGNCSRMVSYRHGADVIHLSRKLFANSFLFGVSHCVSYR